MLRSLVAGAVLAASLGTVSAFAVSKQDPELQTVQLLVWNRAHRTVDLEVAFEDSVVLRENVSSSKVASAISSGAVLHLPAGEYRVRVKDHTRESESSVTLDIRRDAPNIGVILSPAGTALVVTEHPYLADFTPGFLDQ